MRQQIFARIYFRELVVIRENKSGQNPKIATSFIKPNFDFFQTYACYIPIDAEFYADFKNVYFYIIILDI